MRNQVLKLPQNIYFNHLSVIEDIQFTPREIDIIACLMNGRGAKAMASLLGISPKTVETHSRNIMHECVGNHTFHID